METAGQITALPTVPLRGMVALPRTSLHFDIGRLKSVKAVENAVETGREIFLVLQKDAAVIDPKESDIHRVGTVCTIKQTIKLPGDNLRVLVEGNYAAAIEEYIQFEPYVEAKVIPVTAYRSDGQVITALRRNLDGLIDQLALTGGKVTSELKAEFSRTANVNDYVYAVASAIVKNEDKKQQILENADTEKQLEKLILFIADELEIAKLEKLISNKVRKQIDKGQREYYLREQMRVIQEELGDDADEALRLTDEVKAKKLPKESEEKVLKELSRMAKMPVNSPEAGVVRSYVEWVLDLPWTEKTQSEIDIKKAERVLDEDHYGLEKVKERILEFIAVKKLTDKNGSTILCFVGPPGVGKTSIVKSIARALDRKYVRMSLGGVRDEAEIRGHRRTYLGAMPGRILYHMRNAGVTNPVFLLDEIDKMSSDFRGDPTSSMLEVLDPEQNAAFRDHFLEIPYDLSKVMFIATANTLEDIPDPLRDRMEVIMLSGYTDEEKHEIAKRYLVKKRAEINGLDPEGTTISDAAVDFIISGYTREAGVRNLERQIDGVLRKKAKQIVESGSADLSPHVALSEIESLLGPEKYKGDEILKTDEVGTVTGLAWTAVGGTTLSIEVTLMKGKGDIQLTGHLGDVMKESARTALSYIRSMASQYHISDKMFTDYDIHIHVPEGAVPKDGPSAGITMATAILSALTGKRVNHDIAMTGEITLRGNVLPIGGLKEKSLAAFRAGIGNVIFPSRNEKDLDEIPKSVREKVNFIPVSDVQTVFQNSLIGGV